MAENKDVELGVSPEAASAAQTLINSIRETSKAAINNTQCIYMAPDNLRNLSPCSFTPQVVSIGPLHRNDLSLQRFEEQKYALVNDLLSRLGSPEKAFTKCMEKVVSKIEIIKIWYANMESYDDSVLATMMVTDACFILEFISQMSSKDFTDKVRWQNERVPYDLVLLENQIPFFVLKDIYQCLPCFDIERQSLTSFIHPFLKLIDLFQGSIKPESSGLHDCLHDHILHCLYNCYQPKETILSSFPRSTIHSVTELEKTGVSFKPNKDAKWPMAIQVKMSTKFSSISWYMFKNPLKMPALRVDVFTELVLRNLIAYEQSKAIDPYVTSYARAMDMLIDTHEDIAKLVASEVMVNHIGSNEEAANMINRICKEVAPRDFYYTQEWELLDKHFNEYWPKKIVKLKRTYFDSPWSIIALLAGMVLFVLAMLQTIFTINPT
ncbi:UPF0481 protein At3g47200-like [Bidens hawaiensis]|uniref:UPF0481 protein At3g47200-like n=1 Tax=Bidens hawaiensis TaxID=980011 RepID=UPI004049326C